MDYKYYKSVEDSKSSSIKSVLYEDLNPQNRLFGGRLLQWMDEIAGVTAIRHCGTKVTTASIDNLQFKKPVSLGDLLILEGRVIYVGRTSLEVRVDVYREESSSGMRYPINRAFFTEVSVNDNGIPTPIEYGLNLNNESEQAEYEGAIKRINLRKVRKGEGW